MSTVSIITSRYTVDVAGTSGNRVRLYVNYTESVDVCMCVQRSADPPCFGEVESPSRRGSPPFSQ